jgi:hypothetical protein
MATRRFRRRGENLIDSQRKLSFWRWLGEATRVKNPYKAEVIFIWATLAIPILGLVAAFIAPAALHTQGYNQHKNPSPTTWEREGPDPKGWEGEGAGHGHPLPPSAPQTK